MITDRLILGPHVREALNQGRAVVALESTIITHGMPYPQNFKMARGVEDLIRKNGAVPATVAIMDGQMIAGVDEAGLERLSRDGHTASKVSRRDLAAALAGGGLGGTTVATTMMIAAMAGIHVFATGGIGGVHRGAETTFDISADLLELARTPVTVVAAGAKAILDLPKTLEVLETHGVPVISVGQDAFPGFWFRDSGLKSPLRIDDAAGIARAAGMRAAMGLAGGQLVANPIPEADEIARAVMMPVIEAAIAAAEAKGIAAKEVTPFLLDHIFNATDGASLTANIALVENNARLAARIALAFGSTK